MNGFKVLVKKEVAEQWKTFRLPVITIIFLFFGFLSPLTAKFLPEILKLAGGDQFTINIPTPTVKDAIDQLLKNVGQFAPIAAILLAMGSIATEKERGTAALVLTKPVNRWAFLAAKFVGLAVTLAVAIFAAFLAAYFYTAVLFEVLPIGGYLIAYLLVLLAVLVFVAITLLGSVLVNSAIAAGGIGLAVWIGFGLVGAIPTVSDYLPTTLYNPARQFSLGSAVTGWLAPLLVSIALIGLSVAGAWASFRRQEL
jgi:ABC-2 type transport system permease protein